MENTQRDESTAGSANTINSSLAEAEVHRSDEGTVKIGVWSLGGGGRIEDIYEPDADKPFLVRVTGTNRAFEEADRYEYRYEGDEASKAVMRKYP